MLSEISQSPKDKHCVIPLTKYLEPSYPQRQKVEPWAPGAGGGLAERQCSMRTQFWFHEMKKF